ncbi:hypothetical protein LTR84_002049 [Exophiala bonariae]|uniref:Fungal lipase-type domain-containing protein n=1 Tax=Exophiala bonariae TaxID=1690606 RepID=A0AAV9NET9_9EURO|nr:hypothetical protein LTR84_002049 [Exophiala bonariae]
MATDQVQNREKENPWDEWETESMSPLLVTSVADVVPETRSEIIEKIESGLVHVNRFINTPVIIKYGVSFVLQSGASLVRSSKSVRSADNVAASARASAEATRHLALVLSDAPLDKKNQLGWEPYRLKLEQKQKQMNEGRQRDRKAHWSESTWELVQTAARLSKEVYNKYPMSEGIIFEAQGDSKATIVTSQNHNGHGLLVVAIKGSESRDDWLLNFNGEPTESPYSKKLLDGTMKWHKGFLHVASVMDPTIVAAIKDVRNEQPDINTILFTGHSAGGAIAQIFLAASNSPGTECYKAVAGCSVSCITFGCPPVASKPIPPAGSGEFIAVINDDDPVPLAQEAYIKTLIDVYTLDKKSFNEKHKPNSGAAIHPEPALRVSGDCIVLKDVDPDAEDDTSGYEALEVPSEDIEKSLFGNPLAHMMDEYLRRLAAIASQYRGGS